MSRLALFLVVVCACHAVPNPPMLPPPPPPARPEPLEKPDVTATPHASASAEVARLQALADKDPMLAEWTGPYGGVPPFDKMKAELFPGAFTTGIALQKAEIDVIATNPEPATFQNTYAALENAGRGLGRAEALFSVMTSNLKTDDVAKIDEAWSPKLAAASDAITFDKALFARLKSVYDGRTSMKLEPDQLRLVEIVYDNFVRSGANLTDEQKQELGKINQDLASAFTDFENKVLKEENTWTVLDTEKDLAGLGKDLVSAYKAAADERKLSGKWAVVNTRSSVDPFLSSSSRRDLREKVWKLFKNRGDNGGDTDTKATIIKIVELRQRRAKLLGYASHAHWRMADTMAKDPQKALDLLMRVWPAELAGVKQEVGEMQKIAKKDGVKTFEPWDYLYYAEKVRKAKYAIDQDEVKQYFQLDKMIDAAFYMADKLYDLEFTEVTGKVPVFHDDMRVWTVTDKSTGTFRGVFYGDYFARPGKRSGAWQSTYHGHETFTGKVVPAIASNNNNVTRGGAGEPTLLSFDDAQTLFHEFGHAIHAFVSEVRYPTLGETPRDFVEYPSQVHEMWVLTKPILEKFALSAKTKKPMPEALIKKIEASRAFNSGYSSLERDMCALVDLKLHLMTEPLKDVDAFERDTLAAIGAPREVAMRHRLAQFLHLFGSDAYSAGYYSYLWSEVMAADTEEAFRETGDVFDKATANKMKQFILAPGNSTDRAEAYRQFRGRDPDVGAYSKKHGFPVSK